MQPKSNALNAKLSQDVRHEVLQVLPHDLPHGLGSEGEGADLPPGLLLLRLLQATAFHRRGVWNRGEPGAVQVALCGDH